jgi:hypothetical protein
MTTSGTYDFNPSLGELVLYAYNVAGLRNTSLLQEHFQTARMATNLMLSAWSNKGVNLWKVDLVETALVQGQATYAVDAKTVMVLDAYMRIDNGSAQPIDRIILPVSRTEYASYANKEQQGFSTTFWFDRLISPTITLWPVPDGTSAQYLRYYRVTQAEDAAIQNGQTVDIPYRWLEAFADGLAYRLAKIWKPEMAAPLKALADESYNVAAYQDVEQANQYITPQVMGYYRV